MTSHFPLSGPLTVGDLLDRAFRLYRARFGVFLLTAAIFLIPLAVISGLLTGSFIGDYLQIILEQLTDGSAGGFTPFASLLAVLNRLFGAIMLVSLLSIAANGIVTLALTAQSIEALHGRSRTFSEGIRRGVRRFWPYVGMTIARGAAMGAATIAVMIPGGILAVLALIFAMPGAYEVNVISVIGRSALIFCGYALLFILVLAPITYLSARWLVTPAVLIAGGSGPLASLRRSWRLSRGHIRRAMGYVVLLYVIMTLVISFPAALLQQIIFLLRPSGALGLAIGISTVISSLLSIIGTPFYIGAVVLLYYDLRIRGESYDLEMRIAGLEEQAAQDADPESAAPYSDVERVD